MLLIRKYIRLIGQKKSVQRAVKLYIMTLLCVIVEQLCERRFKKSYKLFFKLVKSQNAIVVLNVNKTLYVLWFYSLTAQTCVVWSGGIFLCWCHHSRQKMSELLD